MTKTSEIRGMTLYQCFNSVPPNFSAAQRLLEQGAHINTSEDSDGTPLLAQIIMDCFYGSESKYLPAVVRFFLENGYDVHKDNGKYGGEALYALCYSSYDKYILDAAKLLLDAGADPLYVTDTMPEEETVLDVVSGKASAGIPVYDSLEQECLFWVLYDIMEAKAKTFLIPASDGQMQSLANASKKYVAVHPPQKPHCSIMPQVATSTTTASWMTSCWFVRAFPFG